MAEKSGDGEAEVQRVFDALDGLKAIDDPAARAKAISAFLKEQQPRLRELSKLRQEYVRAQREKKVPRWKIAEEIGVSPSTVQDIEVGYSGSGKTRPRKKDDQAEGGQ